MKKSLKLLCIFSLYCFTGSAQYTPNFSVLNKGIRSPTSAAEICHATNLGITHPTTCPTYDVRGMNWTLTGTTTDPFNIAYDNEPGSISYAKTISTASGNKFEVNRPLGDICMTSPVIDIAGKGPISISINISRTGTGLYGSVNDDVELKYILNGSTLVTSGSLTGGPGTTVNWNRTGITGNTIQVFACMASNYLSEEYRLNTFTVSGGVVLPIELSGFFAKINPDNHVILDWQTAMERNNAYFDIERSADGQHFKSIGQVKSLGNTTSGNTYQHIDTDPLVGVAYYRLKQMDDDGTFEFSPIVSVNTAKARSKVRIVSNPVAQILEIGLAKADNNKLLTLSIIDLTGKIVKQEARLHNANSLLTMDVSPLPAGLYFLKVGDETVKFVKQ